MSLYTYIRPLITKGDILNEASVTSQRAIVIDALQREKAKHSQTRIMQSFYHSLHELMNKAIHKKQISQVIDVGCAQGDLVAKLALDHPELSFIGVDIIKEFVERAIQKYDTIKNLHFINENFLSINRKIYGSSDIILCLETLEHIEDDILVNFIEKLFKTSQKAVIISVPREPLWCVANMMRLKYVSRLGNTPSHLQHWTKQGFERLITTISKDIWGERIEYFSCSPLKLWTMVLFINMNRL